MIAGGACCTRARGQKGLKLAQPMQAKPEQTPNTQRTNACEGKWRLNIHGLKWAGIKGRLTAKVSGPQNAGPLDRKVRPEGQKGTPSL